MQKNGSPPAASVFFCFFSIEKKNIDRFGKNIRLPLHSSGSFRNNEKKHDYDNDNIFHRPCNDRHLGHRRIRMASGSGRHLHLRGKQRHLFALIQPRQWRIPNHSGFKSCQPLVSGGKRQRKRPLCRRRIRDRHRRYPCFLFRRKR